MAKAVIGTLHRVTLNDVMHLSLRVLQTLPEALPFSLLNKRSTNFIATGTFRPQQTDSQAVIPNGMAINHECWALVKALLGFYSCYDNSLVRILFVVNGLD